MFWMAYLGVIECYKCFDWFILVSLYARSVLIGLPWRHRMLQVFCCRDNSAADNGAAIPDHTLEKGENRRGKVDITNKRLKSNSLFFHKHPNSYVLFVFCLIFVWCFTPQRQCFRHIFLLWINEICGLKDTISIGSFQFHLAW